MNDAAFPFSLEVKKGTCKKSGDEMASRLLVIDESPDILELYQLIFASEEYEVLVTPPGVQTVVEIEQLRPDIIILAAHLRTPKNEHLLLHQLAAYSPTSHLPLILCTADNTFVEEQETFLQAHGVVVVLKPFKIDDLVGAVQQALQRKPNAEPLITHPLKETTNSLLE